MNDVQRARATGIKLLAGEIIGGVIGLIIGAYVIMPALGSES